MKFRPFVTLALMFVLALSACAPAAPQAPQDLGVLFRSIADSLIGASGHRPPARSHPVSAFHGSDAVYGRTVRSTTSGDSPETGAS